LSNKKLRTTAMMHMTVRRNLHSKREKWPGVKVSSLSSSETALQAAPPSLIDFAAALRNRHQAAGRPALIAEIKRASPSRGTLASGVVARQLALIYQQNGAAALSVLTDEKFFQGNLDDLYKYFRRIGAAGTA
jgi:indole-3-glycerol phosphate synthase